MGGYPLASYSLVAYTITIDYRFSLARHRSRLETSTVSGALPFSGGCYISGDLGQWQTRAYTYLRQPQLLPAQNTGEQAQYRCFCPTRSPAGSRSGTSLFFYYFTVDFARKVRPSALVLFNPRRGLEPTTRVLSPSMQPRATGPHVLHCQLGFA